MRKPDVGSVTVWRVMSERIQAKIAMPARRERVERWPSSSTHRKREPVTMLTSGRSRSSSTSRSISRGSCWPSPSTWTA